MILMIHLRRSDGTVTTDCYKDLKYISKNKGGIYFEFMFENRNCHKSMLDDEYLDFMVLSGG